MGFVRPMDLPKGQVYSIMGTPGDDLYNSPYNKGSQNSSSFFPRMFVYRT